MFQHVLKKSKNNTEAVSESSNTYITGAFLMAELLYYLLISWLKQELLFFNVLIFEFKSYGLFQWPIFRHNQSSHKRWYGIGFSFSTPGFVFKSFKILAI